MATRPRKPIPWRVAVVVWVGSFRRDDDPRCFYCDVPMTPETAVLDHYRPVVLGGTDDVENLRVCCIPCNQWKGAQDGDLVLAEMRCTPSRGIRCENDRD